MSVSFPSEAWAKVFMERLNASEKYAEVARNWEGDFYFVVQPDEHLPAPVTLYLDLWHGKCRDAFEVKDPSAKKPVFVMSAPYATFVKVIRGQLDAVQAMLTRKLSLKGDLVMLMKNVPTVQQFVKICAEVEATYPGFE